MKKSSKIILSALASAGVLAAAATAWAYPAGSGGVPLPCRRPDARTGPGDASGGSG